MSTGKAKAAAFALLLSLAARPVPLAADTTGGIRGYVVDAATGLREAGADVDVGASGGYDRHVRSGPNGFFVLLGLAPGAYWVTFTLANGGFGGCPTLFVPIVAGNVRSVRLTFVDRHGLLSCGFRRLSGNVDSDQTSDVYSFGADGNPIP